MFAATPTLVRSLRPSTRLWYDMVAPFAMVVAMVGMRIPWWPVAGVVAAVVLFHGGQTLFNDVADIAVDRASHEDSRFGRATVTGSLSRPVLLGAGWVMVATSLVLALMVSWTSFAVLLLALPTVLSYNFRSMGGLSGRPMVTQLFWPVTWVMIYLLGGAAVSFEGWRAGLEFLLFVLLFMGIGEGLCQDIRDADNDAAGGRVTTIVYFGTARSAVWAWMAFAASLVPLALFVARYGPIALAAVLVVLVGWLVLSARFTLALRAMRTGAFGKWMHVGSIVTYTLINLTVISAAAVTY